MISAEAAYHSATGGYYGTLSCLMGPTGAGCIASYPTNAPTFIDSQLGIQAAKSGYNRSMDDTAVVPRLGLSCFVYHATPTNLGQTGVRGFAGACSGVICQTPDGIPVPAAGGNMAPTCMPIQ